MSSSRRTTPKRRSAERTVSAARATHRNVVRRAAPSPGAGARGLTVRFWGVRGSIPSPGAHTRRYGGNTPCVEVRFGEELLIFDLGSGARALGRALDAAPVRASIFLSHYHHDHLQGLPFFTPLYEPANAFTVYGPSREGRGIRSILEAQMKPPYFPVTARAAFKARVAYREFKAGQVLRLGGGTVAALELNHPGGNLGYRIDHRGRSVVYATDIEHGSPLDERFFRFARGADLLIYDAMYTEDEYADRVGWGHSTWQAAVNAADRSEARTLVLFHHDPMRDDAGVERVLRAVRRHRPEAIAARESMVLRA